MTGVAFEAPDRVFAQTADGRELVLGLCDTDFALLVLANHSALRRLPQNLSYVIRDGWRACLDRVLLDPGSGLVLQGPQTLAPSPEQIGRAKKGPLVASWQIVKVKKQLEQPGFELAFFVDAGAGQEGWISAHHLARGSSRQRGLIPSQGYYALENQLMSNPSRYDSWRLDSDFQNLRAFGANLTAALPILPRGDGQFDEAVYKSLPPRTIDDFLKSSQEALALVKGLWVPLAYGGQGTLSCEQLPARLLISPNGQTQLTFGKTKTTLNPQKREIEGNGALVLYAKADDEVAALRVYYVNVPKGQIWLRFPPTDTSAKPLRYMAIEPGRAQQIEEELARQLRCATSGRP